MIGIVLAILVGYVAYKVFFAVEPTCFDSKQNQDERGIDCGGICARVCPRDAKTIVPLWSRVFQVTPGVYSAVAYVENQNRTAGVAAINYEFRAYDADNILAAEPVTGTAFIGPNERTAIFASPIKTGNRIPTQVFFTFTSVPQWTTLDARYAVPQLTSANTMLADVDRAPKLSADVVNTTLFDYRNVQVVAILYGADGNAIAASKTIIETIPQQTTQKAYFTWPQKLSAPVTRIEIIPRINPFVQQ